MAVSDYYFIGLVLTDSDKEDEVLKVWAEAGTSGITNLDCEGVSQAKKSFRRDDMPLIPSLSSLFGSSKTEQNFLFTLVSSEATMRQVIKSTQEVLGKPGNGILFALPVPVVVGV